MINEKIKEIFMELEVTADFNDESELYDIGFDSIKIMELIVLIEEKFEIQINDDDLLEDNFSSVENVKQLITKYL